MFEQEIKMYVPTSARKAVNAALVEMSGSRRARLWAMYFDTPDRQLARQKAAIRLRKEGPRWVQTFKMAGGDELSRIELNHPRPEPTLDLSVYADTPAEHLIGKLTEPLVLGYETDVMRLTREVKTRGGIVEVVYDVGAIRAGELALPVNELEFELLTGDPRALFLPAARMLREHHLILDARSKAERGDALAQAWQRILAAGGATDEALAAIWEPTGAAGMELARGIPAQQALEGMGGNCYRQIVRNAAILAGVDDVDAGGPEHIHQLRVGIRRLRSAWCLCHDWTSPLASSMRQQAKRFFRALGVYRDDDVLAQAVAPALQRAGMPEVTVPVLATTDPGGLVRSSAYQRWQLDLLAWSCGLAPAETAGAAAPSEALEALFARRLHKWHRKLVVGGKHFATLSDDARHALRKRAKRLRYGLAFSASLLPPRRIRKYLRRLKHLQEILGEINDLVGARARYRETARVEPAAWFAVGWTTARLDALYAEADAAFAALDRAKPFWKK